jgi:hypothetical protein
MNNAGKIPFDKKYPKVWGATIKVGGIVLFIYTYF